MKLKTQFTRKKTSDDSFIPTRKVTHPLDIVDNLFKDCSLQNVTEAEEIARKEPISPIVVLDDVLTQIPNPHDIALRNLHNYVTVFDNENSSIRRALNSSDERLHFRTIELVNGSARDAIIDGYTDAILNTLIVFFVNKMNPFFTMESSHTNLSDIISSTFATYRGEIAKEVRTIYNCYQTLSLSNKLSEDCNTILLFNLNLVKNRILTLVAMSLNIIVREIVYGAKESPSNGIAKYMRDGILDHYSEVVGDENAKLHNLFSTFMFECTLQISVAMPMVEVLLWQVVSACKYLTSIEVLDNITFK